VFRLDETLTHSALALPTDHLFRVAVVNMSSDPEQDYFADAWQRHHHGTFAHAAGCS